MKKQIRENYTLKDIADAFRKGMESQERIDKDKVLSQESRK